MSIHPLSDKDGAIVKVTPPKAPSTDEKLSHVPCDIVLVIDVSGSMNAEAPMPRDPNNPEGDSEASPGESTGLSVLDLVKHSCRTILTSMNKRDRLSIIKFSSTTTVLQGLEFMTDSDKEKALENVEKLQVEGSTNLWHALMASFKVFKDAKKVGNVPAIMVLTDGKPNHMCPPQGYIPALREMEPIKPAIHTFGFGYELRSGLLKSIAEFGGGNYAFIPDAGMIGTTFVHAVAHLQSTFARNASLHLTCPDRVTLEETTGPYVTKEADTKKVSGGRLQLTIPLGNIQYGQSRDIYLRWNSATNTIAGNPVDLSATLEYTPLHNTDLRVEHKANRSLADISVPLSPEEVAYHISRSRVCAFLAALFPIDDLGEHRVDSEVVPKYGASSLSGLQTKQAELQQLIQSLPAAQYPEDPRCKALLQDLHGGEPFGQVTIALSSQSNFDRWGQHYLTSLHGAHARQLCTNFKDPGPLQYGTESPLFLQCRNALDKAFNDLPPPTPSLRVGPTWWQPPGPPRQPPDSRMLHLIQDPLYRMRGAPRPQRIPRRPSSERNGPTDTASSSRSATSNFSMVSYNSSSNPCFAGATMVELASGVRIQMQRLRKGMRVATPLGPRSVVAVLATPVKEEWMVNLEGVLVTPWHPVTLSTHDASTGWQFPCLIHNDDNDNHTEMVQYTGYIYSVLLQRDEHVDAHAILLTSATTNTNERTSAVARRFWGVTLGHGLVAAAGAADSDDVRAHSFFGNYTLVEKSLRGLDVQGDGCLLTGGVTKSETTGLACGFKKKASEREPMAKGFSLPFRGKSDLVRHKRQVCQVV